MCVSVLSGTSQTDRPSSNRHPSLPGRWASVSLSVSFSHTRASASSFTSPCARYVYVPSLCANESVADLTRKKTHTRTHILTGGEEKGREEEREKKRWLRFPLIPQSNTSPPFVWFHSIVSSFRFVPFHVLLLCLCLHSSPVLSFFALHPFSPPSHRSLSFPSIPSFSSPRSSFQVLGPGA